MTVYHQRRQHSTYHSLFFSLCCWWLSSWSLVSAVSCDADAYPAESTKASKLTPNTFHKLCPSQSSLGAPICGDGTPFSFYYSSPVRRRSSNKILVEFLGGGACWDSTTCEYQAELLTFPYAFDNFLGMSCTEIQAGLNQNGGQFQDTDISLNMLCAEQLSSNSNDKNQDGVDFRDYHTLIVPYCTQDTHMGSNTVTYDDGTTVHHTGAHNMLSVLEWIYSNFPHPEHIVITGCSAGGTVLPLVYDLLHHHYNSWKTGKQQTALSTIMDSPVYLTPDYFLQNGFPNWNVEPIMKKLRFNFQKYSLSEDYSTRVMEHVLQRGSNRNPWGMITHTQDPVSLAYFQAMSSNYYGDDDGGGGRFLEDNASEDEWWSELSGSITTITSKHKNVDSFFIDSEGHCSFGLFYGLTEGGENFQSWATSILKIPRTSSPSGSGWFWVSMAVASSLVGATIYHQRRMHTAAAIARKEENRNDENDGVLLSWSSSSSLQDDSPSSGWREKAKVPLKKIAAFVPLQKASAFVARYTQDAPITIAYGVAVTIYFIGLMTWDGLEDIIYNPSIGPSATTMSAFGINNPTLVVYRSQFLRVLKSTFLCSGIVTYIMVTFSLYRYIRPLEQVMRSMVLSNNGSSSSNNNNNCDTSMTSDGESTSRFHFASTSFLQVAALISIGSNIVYAFLASGASCSSMALILGLQTFSCMMHRHHQQPAFPAPLGATLVMFLVTCLLLPFNSWIMIMCAMALGTGLAIGIYWISSPAGSAVEFTKQTPTEPSPEGYASYNEDLATKTTLMRRQRPYRALLGVLALIFVCLAVRIRRPKRMYEQPFLTGCDLMYTTHVDDIVNSYVGGQMANYNNNDGDRNRKLEEDNNEGEEQDEEHMCAQFCVPHLVSRPLIWGANIYTGFDVQRGWCDQVGYSQHIADKTFSYKSYSVDVELYFDDNYYMDNNGED